MHGTRRPISECADRVVISQVDIAIPRGYLLNSTDVFDPIEDRILAFDKNTCLLDLAYREIDSRSQRCRTA
jgi:hypothetical protein